MNWKDHRVISRFGRNYCSIYYENNDEDEATARRAMENHRILIMPIKMNETSFSKEVADAE